MRVLETRHLRGVSAWSAVAALQAVIGEIPGDFVAAEHSERLERQVRELCVPPHLAQAAAGRRARRPTPRDAGQFVAEFAGELQFLCGEFHGARKALPAPARGVCHVVLECREFKLGEACLHAAVEYLNASQSDDAVPLSRIYASLRRVAEDVCPYSSPGLVVSAAHDRGIPVFRLGPDQAFCLAPDEVLQLGEGIYQRRLHPWGTMTDRTGFIAGHLANDKAFVKELWSQYGIPVPEGTVVTDESGARRAAAELGGPVVVKPVDAECGRGLTLGAVHPDEVAAAFAHAKSRSTSGAVIVERFLPGTWHRLLVVDRRLVAALRREPASVTGDGRSTIRELVNVVNCDHRRGPDDRWPLRFISLEETELEHLANAGLTPESVVDPGRRVTLRKTASAASGAESVDVTDQIHPQTQALALEAVGLLGLDIAGLDLIATDTRLPLAEQQGAFLEINEQPAIFIHAAPLCSPPRPVGEAIVESLFPGGSSGRIPLVVVIGRHAADCAAARLAQMLADTGRLVGLTTPERTTLGGRAIHPSSGLSADRLHVLLRHPRTELVVMSTPLEEILQAGLGTDQCSMLVLVEGWSTPELAADDAEQNEMARLLQRLAEAADRRVINVADRTWDDCASVGDSDVCLVTSRPDDSAVCDHLTGGGTVVIFDQKALTIQAGGMQTQYYPAGEPPDRCTSSDARLATAMATAGFVVLTRALGTGSVSPEIQRLRIFA